MVSDRQDTANALKQVANQNLLADKLTECCAFVVVVGIKKPVNTGIQRTAVINCCPIIGNNLVDCRNIRVTTADHKQTSSLK